jgi:hypothetical protein
MLPGTNGQGEIERMGGWVSAIGWSESRNTVRVRSDASEVEVNHSR